MQVFYVKSNIKEVDTAYVFENDTLKITYDLWDNGGKMRFTVYNKLSVPLFIDWKNSAFIKDGLPNPYWIDKTDTKTSSSGYYYKGFAGGNSAGTMVHDDRVTFVPPHSNIIKRYKGNPKDYRHELDKLKEFRNYIAYSTNEDTHGETFADSDFQLTEVKIIKRTKMRSYENSKRFYVR